MLDPAAAGIQTQSIIQAVESTRPETTSQGKNEKVKAKLQVSCGSTVKTSANATNQQILSAQRLRNPSEEKGLGILPSQSVYHPALLPHST